MDNFNKVISFILGLVVVIVFFAVITGRLNLGRKPAFLTKSDSPTPTTKITPTPISSLTIPASQKTPSQSYSLYQKTPNTIPAAGSPTLLLPIFFSLSGLGFFLRGRKPRDL